MSAATKIYVFPINKERISLIMDEEITTEALEKASIYSKALSSHLIQIISSQEKPLSDSKLTNMLYLSIDLAKKIKHYISVAQIKIINSSNLLRLFCGLICTLEEMLDGNLDSENTANLLYGIYELLNEINTKNLIE